MWSPCHTFCWASRQHLPVASNMCHYCNGRRIHYLRAAHYSTTVLLQACLQAQHGRVDSGSDSPPAQPCSSAPSSPPAVFKFRHFLLLHGGPCAMKMGTDAMLLGAWAEPPTQCSRVLDVGTGSGVLALMMAQKTQEQAAHVHGIDIDAAAVQQAKSNTAASPWQERVHIHYCSLQQWTQSNSSVAIASNEPTHHTPSSYESQSAQHSGNLLSVPSQASFDLIVSNPPYFVKSSKPDKGNRAVARHADVTLPFSELAQCTARLLTQQGRLCVVLPVLEAQLFAAEAAAAGLVLTRLTQVYTKSTDSSPKRHLMQFETAAPVAAAAAEPGQTEALTRVDHMTVLVPSTSSSSTMPAPVNWVFSEQYKQLTVDFHHPDLLS